MQQDFDFNAPTAAPDASPRSAPIGVSELNARARVLLEQSLPPLWVAGEISNFTRAPSGHCYFSLKDARSQVRCVLFRHRSQYLDWQPANGMQVEVYALPTLYEARGEFQLGIDFMRRAGLGALYEAFARLKTRLEQEGLFAATRKRALPPFPRRAGIVTSTAAAALRDVLATLRRRLPSLELVIYPTAVQGEGAAPRIADAINTASKRAECDVLILCRGGGSIEDLWAFNEEVVARALFACAVPVVSGVGHETDFTIADFVADARAATPTAAAEMISPHRMQLASRLRTLHARATRALTGDIERRMQQVDYLGRRLVHPGERVAHQQRHLEQLAARLHRALSRAAEQRASVLARLELRLTGAAPNVPLLAARQQRMTQRLTSAMEQRLTREDARLSRLHAHLQALSPQLVLERGYAIVARADGVLVRDASQLALDDEITLAFARGDAQARVTRAGK